MPTIRNGKDSFSHNIAPETRRRFRAFCEAEGFVQRQAIERSLHLFMALTAGQRRFVMRGTEDDYRRWLAECEAPPVSDHPEIELDEAAKRAEQERGGKRAKRKRG